MKDFNRHSCIIWKPIPGYEDFYEVSIDGQVRRLDYYVNGVHFPSRNRKPVFSKQCGYMNIILSINKKINGFRISRLVWLAFRGPIPCGLYVNHINFNRTDNHICNLELVTPLQNTRHSMHHGRLSHGDDHYSRLRPQCMARGSRHGMSKLSEPRVRLMRKLRNSGYLLSELANKFKITISSIHSVCTGKTWRHVH